MKRNITVIVVTVMLVAVATSAAAAVPQLINYQGRLTRSDGTPLDSTAALIFTICADSLGTTTLWSETHQGVVMKNGLFQVLLGSISSLGQSVFNGQKRWLGIQMQGGAAMTPLMPIVSVAYAYRALAADTSEYARSAPEGSAGGGWSDDGTTVRLTTVTDYVGVGTSSPGAKLEVRNANSSGLATLIRNDSPANSNPALWVETSGNSAAVFGSSALKYGLQGSSANSYGVYGTGGRGVYGLNPSSNNFGYLGSSSYGAFGKDTSSGNYGGLGGENVGVYGNAVNASSYGVFGYNNGHGIGVLGGSTDSMGVYGSSASKYGVYGTGTKGVFGFHPSSNHYGFLGSQNYGVYGKDSTTGVWGAIGGGNAGVVGSSQGTSRVGVFGESSSGGVGIRGSSIDSAGVYGSSATDLGVLGTGVRGVYGLHPSSDNFGYLGSSDYGAYGEYKDSTNWGGLGGVYFGLNAYSWNGYGVYARSYNGTGVYGHSNDGTAVFADGWGGDGLYARVGVGSPSYAAKLDGKVLIRCFDNCKAGKSLEVQGNVFLNQNDGQLVLSTPGLNDPGRYRLKFDNNSLGVICGSDYENQDFAFMSVWGANRKYDAHLKVHGSTPVGGSWGKYIELYHDGTDGYITTDVGHVVLNPANNVGIGTTTPTQKLDVNGTARLRGISSGTGSNVVVDANGVLYKTVSSERYKTNIRQLHVNPEEVLRLTPVRFNWKTTNEEDIGLIAEQTEKEIPDLVIYDQEGRPEAVKYDKVAVYLLELVRSQQQEIASLKVRVQELQSRK